MMITWPDIEAAAKRAGWKRIGREYRGAPCPSCGGGAKRSAWVQPLGDSWGGGCHASGCTGLAVARALIGCPPSRDPRGPLRAVPAGGGLSQVVPTDAGGGGRSEGGAARCAAIWGASVSADGSPGAAYLTRRGAWPAGERLPASVRWLPASAAKELRPRLPGGSAGALCYLFGAPGEADPAAIQCEAVDASGARVLFGNGAKRPSVTGSDFGGGRRVFVARGLPMQTGGVRVRRDRGGVGVNAAGEPVELAVDDQNPCGGDDPGHRANHGRNGGQGFDHDPDVTTGVNLCEGPLDGLALVHLARLGAVNLDGAAVIAAAGAGGWRLAAVKGWPGPVALWPDSDLAGSGAALRLRLALAAAGRTAAIQSAGDGDLTDWAAVEAAERAAIREG